ncbi:hypothetical protein ABZX51_012201 [Aspergillus tubingensis]
MDVFFFCFGDHLGLVPLEAGTSTLDGLSSFPCRFTFAPSAILFLAMDRFSQTPFLEWDCKTPFMKPFVDLIQFEEGKGEDEQPQ